ncbi:uncharacterized protein LOC131941959 [Physella acuta]|uniref:uncharacterized protein LOC131941959 n=1 Tax=Physella acuta TaxID=109671 RepID=UPI0027DB7C91|nr:uncharacterized protein LOC131941959 [Physella acuta]
MILVSLLTLVGVTLASGNLTGKEENQMEELRNVVAALSRQVMLQQFAAEEKIRADGGSGIKQIRVDADGPENFYVNTHSGRSMCAIHDHSNTMRTLGQGEGQYVLNGVEFRTRHNDFQLRMPSDEPGNSDQLTEIPFPPVPPEVLEKPTVHEQIVELREWFQAWKEQNYQTRDYRPYFKPVLCYMEGAWTTNTNKIEEPFFSDRHAIDASTWAELQEKVRFSAYTGKKHMKENFAYLPTTIINITEKGVPVYAQWTYRIACHPLSKDLPTSYLSLVDDLSVRLPNGYTLEEYKVRLKVILPNGYTLKEYKVRLKVILPNGYTLEGYKVRLKVRLPNGYTLEVYKVRLKVRLPHGYTLEEYKNSRAARFNVIRPRDNKFTYWNYLDDLMAEVPGRNGYGANLYDNSFNATYLHPTRRNGVRLNVGYYHRRYRVARPDAMGLSGGRRGYSDPNVFMAETTHESIAPVSLVDCVNKRKCTKNVKRMTYAIPLEIIYLTPLTNWNPYNIRHHDDNQREIVTRGERKGGFEADSAYNGTHYSLFYRTPRAFFSGTEVGTSPADTTVASVGVLDQRGVVRNVSASGVRIFLPKIRGLREMRTRYPIAPVHGESSPVWKELNALKDIVMQMYTNEKYLTEKLDETSQKAAPQPSTRGPVTSPSPLVIPRLRLLTSVATRDPPGEHVHTIELTKDDQLALFRGQILDLTTSQDNSHSHQVRVRYLNNRFHIFSCDDKGSVPCWDGHTSCLTTEDEDSCPADDSQQSHTEY